ncbi:MAG TPA: M1 family metallopeptidase, partial [Polyangia bacterium]
MTARALAVLAICGWSAAAFAARDADVTPERYVLTLSPSAARHSFSGRETIELALAAPARTITLDAIGLAITEARVRAGDATLPAVVAAAHDRVTLTLPTAVSGALVVELAWTGALADDLGGMFAADAGGRRALFTHFEPSGARRVFPCFDTPSHKARFQLTVEIDAGDEAVSNTPVVERTPLPNRRERVRFAETAPLPTYLVALAVGRFATLDTVAGTTPLRVVAPPEQLPLARFALDTAAALLPRFAAYFGRPYAFDKLDLVAVPAFAPGGMENAGAIFLRDDRMLVDPARASPATTHAIALLIAHELAHQWLGDVVTPADWSDLWLAEATATYVAHEIVAAWHPEWRPWDDLQPSIDEVMADDELPAAHPVRASDGGRALFDAIVYTKGAALLRMLAGWAGDDVVRDGFRRLVAEHAFASVAADDLWSALDAAAPSPVSPIARRWFEERGHPTLLVHGSCDRGTLTLLFRRDRPQPATSVPLALRWPGGARVALFDGDETSVRIDGGERCPAWIDANAGRVGFYRVHYDPALAGALADAAEPALDPAERVGLASDAWLDLADGAPLASYLALATRLRGDRAPPVLDELGRRLSFMSAELVRASERSAFERLVDELLEPAHAALGWSARPDDDDATRLGRARAVELIGTIARTPRILAEADRQLRRYLADPAERVGLASDA